MKILKRQKKELDAYQQFQREMFWKQVWQVTKKILFGVGVVFFFLFFAMFYFAKICIGDK